MDNKGFDKDKLIKYWIDDSEDDYDCNVQVEKILLGLFVGHLILKKLIEKMEELRKWIKGLILQ